MNGKKGLAVLATVAIAVVITAVVVGFAVYVMKPTGGVAQGGAVTKADVESYLKGAPSSEIEDILKNAQLRCTCDLSDEKITAKIAKAHNDKVPYMLIVGPKEAQSNTVNIRIRAVKENKTATVEQFLTIAKGKIADKIIDLSF
mgnify:CR=1 FL=1